MQSKMKHKLLVLDAETSDPYLKKHGAGYAFGYHYPEYAFSVLGFAYITSEGEKGYTDDWSLLQTLLDSHDAILAFNSSYDLGCLMYLHSQGKIQFDLRKHFKYDAMILAKLWTQNFFSYSLDNLSKIILKTEKKSDLLHDFAWSTGLFQDHKKKLTGRNTHTRPSDAVLDSFCKSRMALFPKEIVGEYAIEDVVLTLDLFNYLLPKAEGVDLDLYSDLQNIVLESKIRGIRIDLKRAKEVQEEFAIAADTAEQKMYEFACKEFNINSTAQLAPVIMSMGYVLPKTEKGNYSVNKDWLDGEQGEIIDVLKRYKQATKMKRDFVDKLINYQEAIPEQYREDDIGIIFPTMKILGATTTGRFSSGGGMGCLEVNLQQIPTRNKEFGAPCRELFIAHEGEELGLADFSSQEQRIMVHYAKLLNCTGIDEIVSAWNIDPKMDFHQKVASIANISRDQAKTIGLGLAFGMGQEKLIASLGISEQEGAAILRKYHSMLPFMNELRSKAAKGLKTNKYIKTLGGRKLVIGKDRGAERDGLSKLSQGSAACQTKRAMQLCHKAGLNIVLSVHDELGISTANIEKDLPILEKCMETAYTLIVPSVAEGGHGTNWLKAKENTK